MAALLAIIGLIVEGLALTAAAWLLSRWLGKGSAAPKPGRGGEAAWSSGADNCRTEQGTFRTHSEDRP